MLVVAVDAGNRCMKTPHTAPFTSGLNEHGKTPPPIACETIFYEGNYYTLSETVVGNRRDKTTDNVYMVLNLFAIAREIIEKEASCHNIVRSTYIGDIALALGAPVAHTVMLQSEYSNFFSNGGKPLEFEYTTSEGNAINFIITVKYTQVYPQGYSAVAPSEYFNVLMEQPRSLIIDIGGYTTDVVSIVQTVDKHGRPTLIPEPDTCQSFAKGTILMSTEAAKLISNRFGMEVDTFLVEKMLADKAGNIASGCVELAKETCDKYAKDLIGTIRNKGFDLAATYPVFLGGGSTLMKQSLNKAIGRSDAMYISEVRANAIGYESFLVKSLRSMGVEAF